MSTISERNALVEQILLEPRADQPPPAMMNAPTGKVSYREVFDWTFRNMDTPNEELRDPPCAGCWSYLLWARANPAAFYFHVGKRIPPEMPQETPLSKREQAEASVTALKGLLGYAKEEKAGNGKAKRTNHRKAKTPGPDTIRLATDANGPGQEQGIPQPNPGCLPDR